MEVPCIRINTHGQIKMALTKKFTIMYVVGIGWSGVSIAAVKTKLLQINKWCSENQDNLIVNLLTLEFKSVAIVYALLYLHS